MPAHLKNMFSKITKWIRDQVFKGSPPTWGGHSPQEGLPMKKMQRFVIVLALVAILVTACGGSARVEAAPIEQVNVTTGEVISTVMPGPDSGGMTYVFPTPFADSNKEQKVKECIDGAIEDDPTLAVTLLTGSDETADLGKIWWCDTAVDNADLVIMSATMFAQALPGRYDDAVVVASAGLYEAGKLVVKYVLIVSAIALAEQGIEGLIVFHSNREHSPNIEGSDARRVIATFIAAWVAFSTNGGQDPRSNCGEVRDEAGNLIKVAFSFFDAATGKIYTMWYWAKTGGTPWGGAYPKDSVGKGSFEEGPKDLKPGWSWTTGTCGNSGNFIPKLQPAQPAR